MNTLAGREAPDGARFVHVVSRTAGRQILFGDDEKEIFHKILFKQLKFSGLRVMAWCLMGNHFHLLLEVPDRESVLAGMGDEDVLRRLSVFADEQSTKFLLAELADCRKAGNVAGVERIAARVRARLFDLSAFMKELKLRFTLAYNHASGRTGTLWEGRFRSLLVEPGDALRTVAAYIDLNPIRAGIAERPEDYRWCSYAAALGGMRLARSGLVSAIAYGKSTHLGESGGVVSGAALWHWAGGAWRRDSGRPCGVERWLHPARDRGGDRSGWPALARGGAAMSGALLYRRGGARESGVYRWVLRAAAGWLRRAPAERQP